MAQEANTELRDESRYVPPAPLKSVSFWIESLIFAACAMTIFFLSYRFPLPRISVFFYLWLIGLLFNIWFRSFRYRNRAHKLFSNETLVTELRLRGAEAPTTESELFRRSVKEADDVLSIVLFDSALAVIALLAAMLRLQMHR